LSCVLVRPYVRCYRVTVRGSSGARGDRNAEGTYVARGIDSAHSEVVVVRRYRDPTFKVVPVGVPACAKPVVALLLRQT
jgi:hypothetical protein